jgi:hypothetical protein
LTALELGRRFFAVGGRVRELNAARPGGSRPSRYAITFSTLRAKVASVLLPFR